jgi:hypothetical protein
MPPALVKAHNELDKAVDLAYRPQPFTSEANRMVFLFELYEKYTADLFTKEKPKKTKKTTLKHRLKNEGSEIVTKCDKLKLIANDGKKYLTDVADIETIFRLVQSIPSPKAEPFKLWIAKVARERIDEIEDPEIGIDRLMETYLKKGYSKEWINQRLKSIEVRKELTDEWEERGIKKGQEYAILTDEITKAWSGLSVKEYKKHKDLKRENLRDNMTNLELVLNMLAEATTAEISKEKKPKTFVENKIIANQGGTIAGNTRKEIEAKTGKKVVSDLSAKKLLATKNKRIDK